MKSVAYNKSEVPTKAEAETLELVTSIADDILELGELLGEGETS